MLEESSFTCLGGGDKAVLEVTAKSDTTVRIATATDQAAIDLSGWDRNEEGFHYDDSRKTRVQLFSRSIGEGETLRLPRGNWTGSILIFSDAP